MKNKTLIWVLLSVVICILAVVAFHFYLLISKQGIQIHIGNFNIIRLGSPDVFFPKEFEASFKPFETQATNIRVPRYERNALYQSEDQGDIMAKDIDTGQVSKFSWNDLTQYTCINPSQAGVPGLTAQPDPVKNLENYTFIYTGNALGAIQDAGVGLAMFRRDTGAGAPIKFILKNETINQFGGYDILAAIVFTGHTNCVKPADITSDLQWN